MRTPEGLPPMGLRRDPDEIGPSNRQLLRPAADQVVLERWRRTNIELASGPWTLDRRTREPAPGSTYGFRVSGPWEPEYDPAAGTR